MLKRGTKNYTGLEQNINGRQRNFSTGFLACELE